MAKFGLIYDVDGVIGNTEPVNAQVTIRVLEKLFKIDNLTNDDFVTGLGRGAAAYTKAGAAAHGVTLDGDQLEKAVEMRERGIRDAIIADGLGTFKGVLELMHAGLDHPDFAVGIASSADAELVEAILRAVNAPYDKLTKVTGDMVSHKKPDPEVFLKAAEAISVKPEKCVIIEDAPDGVCAAKNAGAQCIGVTNSVPADKLNQADRIVKSLAEISITDLIDLIES